MKGCLSDTDLLDYHASQLDENERNRVRMHLQTCATCAERDTAMVSLHESWVEKLRSAGPAQRRRETSDCTSVPHGTIAGYEIVDEISRGGQGIVYRALQKSTKREVALKVLREGPLASRAARKRFEREVEVVAGLRHPNIVALFDSGVTADGRHYCVMDYVRGVRLDRYVRDRGVKLDDVLRLFATVCDAVNFAHQHGVIHRDLKPSNILVEENGDPRVLDFGLAKPTGTTDESLATTTQLVVGTLPYLSPEQARGRYDEVDIRSDVYALGVILYELITGRLPYPVEGDISTVLRTIAETPPIPPHRGADRHDPSMPHFTATAAVDDEIGTMLLKVLSKERERRYQSAGDFARDIRHYLVGEPIEAKRDSGWYILSKTLRRHRAAVAVSLAFLILVVTAVIGLAVLYGKQSKLLTEVQKQKSLATGAEATARQRFDELRGLARTVIFELDNRVRFLSGSTPARELLVKTGLDYLNRLASTTREDDWTMQVELGAGYFRLGDVQGDPDLPNLGDRKGALESYQRGLRFVEATARAWPDDKERQKALATAYNRIGHLLCDMDRREEGNTYFKQAKSLLERLATRYPDDREVQSDLTFFDQDVAYQYRTAGRLDEAMEIHRKNLSVLEKDPMDPPRLHAVSAVRDQLGRILTEQGKLDDAMEQHRLCRDLLECAATLAPNEAQYRRDLAIAFDRMGLIEQQRGNAQLALAHIRKSLEISQKLCASDPADRKSLTGVASSHCRIGEIALAAGDRQVAQENFEQYHEVATKLVKLDRSSSAAQRDLAVSHYKLAELQMSAAKRPDAAPAERLASWRKARASLQACLEVFTQLQDKGLLAPSDANVKKELTGEIATCNDQIAAMSSVE